MIKEVLDQVTISDLNTAIIEYGMFGSNHYTEDLNLLVDGIIDISPAYNIDSRYDNKNDIKTKVNPTEKKIKKQKKQEEFDKKIMNEKK